MKALPAVVALVLLASCREVPDGALGFQCSGDEDCDGQTVCRRGLCARPPSGAWTVPDETTTGVLPNATLTPSGNLSITSAGVYEGLEVLGCVEIRASDVTLRNSRLRGCTSYFAVTVLEGLSGVVLEDLDIEGNGAAAGSSHYTARRLNVHGVEQGFNADQAVTIEDCYVHDLRGRGFNGIVSLGGGQVVFRHNRVVVGPNENSAILINAERGAIDDVLVQENLLDGGGFTLFVGQSPHAATHVRILGNRFGRAFGFGAMSVTATAPELADNVWDDTREPIQ